MAAAALTTSPCVALFNPPAATVIVGVPTNVSLYLKLAMLTPLAMLTLVMVLVSAVLPLVPLVWSALTVNVPL